MLLPKKSHPFIFLLGTIFCIAVMVYFQKFLLINNYGYVRAFLGFAIGYFSFLLYRKYELSWMHKFMFLFIPIFVTHLYLISNLKDFYYKLSTPVLYAFLMLLIIKNRGVYAQVLNSKPFQFLGKISYSIYLNHAIIIAVFPNVLFKLFNFPKNYFTLSLSLISSILITILWSIFTEKHIEFKLKKWLMSMKKY